jgi:hypothetical protein
MKTKLSLLFSLLWLTVISQNINVKTWKINSLTLEWQPILNSYEPGYFNDLKRILIQSNVNDFPTNDFQIYGSNPTFRDYNLQLGIAKKTNRELLIGINYLSETRRQYYFTKTNLKIIDTIKIQNHDFYLDSVFYSYYSFSEQIDELGFIVSYIYKSDQTKLVSMFSGYGINLSYSYNSVFDNTRVTQSSKNLSRYPDTNYLYDAYYPFDIKSEGKSEEIKGNNNYFMRIFVPLGLNLKITKKETIWKHFNLQIASQFGVEYRYIQNDKGYISPYVSYLDIGLKYNF